ncbi:hypothetical protein [Paraburkholderia caballeronis]|uniref:Uncharacterized protein n=1 Tax=Paraburkholderia caballeronis TaxID=416943 RepID=A0A1H7U4U2_9BURK|nr:hypothetical protein [Paraburkholderia caballeronis]PXW23479.1 hypothetical protein C7403_110218 [Paraburkholderia caballeronis]PXW98472.1 hypothetical protein C7407_110218 [Paraburkholderia caballeronis]RAJ95203.1 hypothetical protein C7409_110219 [Paraburkholderia caballeronis]TDV28616.1 hypothetical protein C7405_1135 [Paraburkholderia caballeronis]SEC51014.1 hypothetical protein SAMN05445871_2342 [Paraburkholderia caballeronis]
MDDTGTALLPVWRANLVLLTREVGAAMRLARMMTFSASYLKLMLSGQRDFSEEFVRGVEAVTGLPPNWMDAPHGVADVPADARDALDNESPRARFRGTAHPVRKASVLRAPEPIFGQQPAAPKRDDTAAEIEAHRRLAGVRKFRDLAVQDVRKLERYLSLPPVDAPALRARIEDVISAADPDDRVRADLAGRLEQIEKHRELLLRHVSKLHELLARLGDE